MSSNCFKGVENSKNQPMSRHNNNDSMVEPSKNSGSLLGIYNENNIVQFDEKEGINLLGSTGCCFWKQNSVYIKTIPTNASLVAQEQFRAINRCETEYKIYTKRKYKVDAKEIPEIQEFQDIYYKLIHDEHYLNQEITTQLNNLAMIKKKKMENLHKKWAKKVYDPLITRIKESNQSPASKPFRKREIYNDYLKYVNKKGCAYLDTFDPKEYHVPPKSTKKSSLNIKDPTYYLGQQYDEEQQLIMSLLHHKLITMNDMKKIRSLSQVDCCRKNVDPIKWSKLHENNILSSARKTRRRINGCRHNKSVLKELVYNYNDMESETCLPTLRKV
ncbi:protein FAM228B-like [Argonauta hians]